MTKISTVIDKLPDWTGDMLKIGFVLVFAAFAMWTVVQLPAPEVAGQSPLLQSTGDTVLVLDDPAIYRFIDREAKAVCWFFEGRRAGGLTCLPLQDTEILQKDGE